jgi:putative peptidoglycan lipid II flippase
LTIPASVAIVILAKPIISTILEHGHFNSIASHNTARALAGFSIGLAGFSIYIFCLRGFYAHEDTRTPFFVNLFENALNIILALFLVERHGVLGLGLSFGIAYMISSVLVLWLLHKKYEAVQWLSLLSLIWRATVGSAVMGAAVWALEHVLHPRSGMSQLAELFLCISGGLVVYIVALYALRVPEMRNLASVMPTRSTDHETTL